MKRFFALLLILCPAVLVAQELSDAQKAALEAAKTINNTPEVTPVVPKPKFWKTALGITLGFNQTALLNWAAGGSNSISLAGELDARANYEKELITWKNHMQLNYAMMWVQDNKLDPFQKTNDRILLESTWLRATNQESKWKYSADFSFRSQFTDGYDYSKTQMIEEQIVRSRISSFMSPAYINLALGMDWEPTKWFSMSLAPLTGSVIVVADAGDDYALRAKYGMKSWTEYDPQDPTKVLGTYYNSALFQLGTQLKADFKFLINEKFLFTSQMIFFYDYFFDYSNPKYCSAFPVRTNWDNKISWQVAKYFKLGLDTWLLFDPLVSFENDQDPSAPGTNKVQFKEFFSINFAWTIASKNNK